MSDLDFRLSTSVRPVRYELTIDVDLDAWLFRGSEVIEVTAQEPTDTVTLHAADLEISSARAMLDEGAPLVATVALNPTAETATLRFPRALPAGRVRIA